MVFRTLWNVGDGALKRMELLRKQKRMNLNEPLLIGLTETHVWKGVNGILDLDINMHMNNASYVSIAELARWNLASTSGLLVSFFLL